MLIYDCEITLELLCETEPLDSTRRELFWMSAPKTIASLGFNIDEGYEY